MSETQNGAVVVARDVTRRYGEGDTAVDALRGVSVEIAPGKATAVMGPSGSGKSTLMHILAGLDKPTSGDVTVAGTEITTLKDNDLTKLRREHIGFVFQFFNLLPMLNAKENILLPLTIAGEKPEDGWFDQLVSDVGLADRLHPSAGRAVGRAAATRRDRSCARLQANGSLRGRADREPRLRHWPRDPRAPAPLGRRVRTDDRDGDARRPRRRHGASRPVPRRWRDRPRDRRVQDPRDPRDHGRSRRRVIKVALRGLAGRKLRAALTGIAIVLGVAMISGTYILTDTVQSAFTNLFTESYAGTDAVVTGRGLDISVDGEKPPDPPVAASLLDVVRGVDGVALATGGVADENNTKPSTSDGKPVSSEGWPTLGFGIDTAPALRTVQSAQPPRGEGGRAAADEVVIDASTVDEQGWKVGDTVQISTLQPKRTFTLVGVAQYGEVDSLGGISFTVFTIPSAQELLGREGSTTPSPFPPARVSPRTSSSPRSSRSCPRTRRS